MSNSHICVPAHIALMKWHIYQSNQSDMTTQIKQVGSLHSGTHIRTSVLLFCSLGYGILLCWLSWLKFQRAAVGTIAMHCQQTPLWCTTLGAANKLKHQQAFFFPVVLQIFLSDLAPSLLKWQYADWGCCQHCCQQITRWPLCYIMMRS